MTLHISSKKETSVENLPFELVERKGVGHPDTICDAIAERASMYYSQYCYKNFGRVAHHWFDKVMLIGGEADISFGYGKITKPYKLIFAGKGAHYFGENKIPIYDIFYEAASDVLKEVLTGFIPEEHVELSIEIVDYHGAGRANSRYRPMTIDDLVDLDTKTEVSNDCNLLSAHAPLSNLEKMVLYGEQYINGTEFKKANPDIGWDVKVFGSRHGDEYKIIANIPFIASYVKDEGYYYKRKDEIKRDILTFIENTVGIKPELMINPQDRNNKFYLTALGSVADTGDVGVVGRGNRLNGLITPMRSMSIEAPAGKNPMDHTGKIYGVLTQDIADKIYTILSKPVEVHIFTAKESPLTNPDEILVRVQGWEENVEDVQLIEQIVRKS